MIALGTYMKIYKVGDIVDIKANGAVQKGVSIPLLNINSLRFFEWKLHENPRKGVVGKMKRRGTMKS
jgi:hypothetical protein